MNMSSRHEAPVKAPRKSTAGLLRKAVTASAMTAAVASSAPASPASAAPSVRKMSSKEMRVNNELANGKSALGKDLLRLYNKLSPRHDGETGSYVAKGIDGKSYLHKEVTTFGKNRFGVTTAYLADGTFPYNKKMHRITSTTPVSIALNVQKQFEVEPSSSLSLTDDTYRRYSNGTIVDAEINTVEASADASFSTSGKELTLKGANTIVAKAKYLFSLVEHHPAPATPSPKQQQNFPPK
ncbi:MAG TPA: hypothetical protein VLG27_00930 [Candidatus Saccharimonadia bacterium]|nr:hypothetical protein [Candidatus Saccharimonadia bacterium]